MNYTFTAQIYKVGINPCVDVPQRITKKLEATKGYIPVKGEINQFFFQQTLCPVKDGPHRLYVNGPMMKGAHVEAGDRAKFSIGQDDRPKTLVEVPKELKQALVKKKLWVELQTLSPSRQKEIFKYYSYLKTDEARERNLLKIIALLIERKM